MENKITDQLAAFNRLSKEMDETYHLYAKKQEISDTILWLLYSLYESNAPFTQRELCSAWHYPPQTINSALKNLERQGVIELAATSDNKKNKLILLTEKGRELAQKIIFPLVHAEEKAFQGMEPEEKELLLSLLQKYVKLLQREIS